MQEILGNTIKNTKKCHHLTINFWYACLIVVLHGGPFPLKSSISIAEFSIFVSSQKASRKEKEISWFLIKVHPQTYLYKCRITLIVSPHYEDTVVLKINRSEQKKCIYQSKYGCKYPQPKTATRLKFKT